MIPEKYKNTCPLDHSTYEKYIECNCNFGSANEVWYFKEQELAKLKEENEKFRKMLQDNEDKYIEYRDDLYYEISKLKELLRRFVPDERTIQWEQREIDARDFLKKYDMAIGHDFRSERLKKH